MSLGGLGQSARTDFIASALLVDGFSGQQEPIDGETRYERPKGVRSSHMDLSHPPERPPGGIVVKQRSEWTRAGSPFGWEEYSIRGLPAP